MQEGAAYLALGSGDLATTTAFEGSGEARRFVYEFHLDNATCAVVHLGHMPALRVNGAFGETGLVAGFRFEIQLLAEALYKHIYLLQP